VNSLVTKVAVVLLQVNKKRARPRPRAPSGFGAKATPSTKLALMPQKDVTKKEKKAS
jgi:hypothetical protein